jgi:hypothetical protein
MASPASIPQSPSFPGIGKNGKAWFLLFQAAGKSVPEREAQCDD